MNKSEFKKHSEQAAILIQLLTMTLEQEEEIPRCKNISIERSGIIKTLNFIQRELIMMDVAVAESTIAEANTAQ
jgi:hypothetical protein